MKLKMKQLVSIIIYLVFYLKEMLVHNFIYKFVAIVKVVSIPSRKFFNLIRNSRLDASPNSSVHMELVLLVVAPASSRPEHYSAHF